MICERRGTGSVKLALIALVLAHAPAVAQPQVAQAEKDELWRKGSAQALANDFTGAARTFSQLVHIDPQDIGGREALEWAKSAVALSEERESMRRKTYEGNLDAARQYVDKGKWVEAIKHVQIAREYALDPADIRKLPWLDELVSKAKDKIAEYRSKGSWIDALIMYEVLARIYDGTPDGTTYSEEAKFCGQRAHFIVAYKKDGEWKKRMVDVQPEIVREVFGRISGEYVVKPDFKEMTLTGLKWLELLAQMKEKELIEVFPRLADADRVSDFVNRIDAERDRVENKHELSWRDAVSRFERLLEINRSTLNLPQEVVVHEFLDGALTPLDDFTSIIWPSEVPEFNKHTRGAFAGVGIQITKPDEGDFINVETPLEDTPAFEAGISPGDLITAVDGKTTKGMQLNDAVRIITGPPGTEVTLTIKRPPAEGTTDVVLKRRDIRLQSVKGLTRMSDQLDPEKGGWDYMIDPKHKIGYIRVSQFTENTADDLKAALKQFRRQGGKGLILDLRFNPGGLLTAAIQVCELFLNEREGIVKTEGRKQPARSVGAQEDGPFTHEPIIVLVNDQSASASEIVAGTLSGNRKALIVGERTFGKGSVQNLYSLADNKGLFKLTTAKYFVPADPMGENWHCLHKDTPKAKTWGVEPNIEVKLFPKEDRKVFELRRRAELLKGRNQKELPASLFERRKATTQSTQPDDVIFIDEEAPDKDPQLETALQFMRVKLISQQPWVLAPQRPQLPVEAHNNADRG